MSACPELNYTKVTASAWECCKAAVATYVKITTDTGEASSMGVTIKWAYNPGAQTLSLQCTSHPFLISCDYINGKIGEAVTGCLGK